MQDVMAMKSSLRSALKSRWITSGSSELWGLSGGTYYEIKPERLPELPNLDDYWKWLETQPEAPSSLEWEREDGSPGLVAMLADLDFVAPPFAVRFLSSPTRYKRVPSCTACYLELSENPIPVPGYPGEYLLRFLNDSQACCLWYLHFCPHKTPCVVSSDYLLDSDIFEAMQYEDAPEYAKCFEECYFSESSIERFVCRFSIENRIWFSLNDDVELTKEEFAYITAAQTKP